MQDIPDVMGLQALRPSAAIVKVLSVPDRRCVRVVTPDDRVNIGFHEVLLHDLEDEDLSFVTLSELGCLRLDWPKTLFTFMSRYQFDLDQMRKDCRERFGSTQSSCTHCGKHIQQNLGKHIALYHMELAQLWRCPVTWCTMWMGMAQDCVGSYMRRLHVFLEELDATSLRRRHRRCAQELAAQMSRTSLRDTEDRTADVSPRPNATRRSVSQARMPHRPVGGGGGGAVLPGPRDRLAFIFRKRPLYKLWWIWRFLDLRVWETGLVKYISHGRSRLSRRRRRI